MIGRIVGLLIAVAVAAVAPMPSPADAATQYTGWRHRYPTICLEQNVDASMGLSAAAKAWNVTTLNYFVAGDRWHPRGCRSYPAGQKVIVSYYSAADGYCAYSAVAKDADGYIVSSVIRVNLRHLIICTGGRPERKAAMLMHELGHDGGLGHVPDYSSILCSGRCGRNLKPSSLDLWRMEWRWRHAP